MSLTARCVEMQYFVKSNGKRTHRSGTPVLMVGVNVVLLSFTCCVLSMRKLKIHWQIVDDTVPTGTS